MRVLGRLRANRVASQRIDLTTRSSPICAPRSVRQRASAEPLELALYARDAGVERGRARSRCAGRGRPTRSRPRCASRARHEPAVRGTRERYRPRRRRHAARRSGRDRHDPDEPRARGRPRRAGRVGRARRAEPRPQSRAVAPPRAALRARPVVAAGLHDRRQRRHQRRRPALPRGRASPRAHVLAVDVVLADGAGRAARRPRARRARLRPPRAASSAPRARWASRPAIAVRLTPDPPAVAHAAARLRLDRRRGRDRERDHRGRHPARRARDDGRRASPRAVEDFVGAGYPRDAEAVLLVELDGLAGGVADAGRRGARDRGASTARGRCASRPTTPSARCSGRAASRRSARSPASRPTTTCTTRWCPARGSSRCCGRSTRSPTRTSSSR